MGFRVDKPLDKTVAEDLARVQSIMEGLDAAEAGYTVPVSQMFNPLRLVASPKNPRSPAFAEPAALDFAEAIARISETSPLQAEQVFTVVGDMLQKLQEFPDLGVKGRYPYTRELAFYGYPITLVYTEGEDAEMTVVAVFYTSETLS